MTLLSGFDATAARRSHMFQRRSPISTIWDPRFVGHDGRFAALETQGIAGDSVDAVSVGEVEWSTAAGLTGVVYLDAPRLQPVEHDSHIELFWGPRFVRFDDARKFTARATDRDASGSSILRAENQLFGHQIGGRWSGASGAWTFNMEGSILAALNLRDGNHNVDARDVDPISADPVLLRIDRDESQFGFSPVAELSLAISYRISESTTAMVGYDLIFAGNLAHADYEPDYGQISGDQRSLFGQSPDFFTDTLQIGVEFVR